MQKPETGQKTGPGPTGKFYEQINQYIKKQFTCINIFSIRPIKSTKTGNRSENRTPDQSEIELISFLIKFCNNKVPSMGTHYGHYYVK